MANKNITQLVQQTGSADPTSLFYTVTGGNTDKSLPLSVLWNNPAFTGIPVVPTAALGTNTAQIASTAFVVGQAATVLPIVDGTATIGTSTQYARQDHIHPTDTSRAPVVSPTFTGNVNITSSGQTNTLRITDTGASGANIELTGNGATTPTKFIRVNAGALQVVNNAYSAVLFNLDDSGNATFTGGVTGTAGSFTTLEAGSTVSGTGFSTYLASPPVIGTTTPAAGKFTTLQATSTITPATTAGIVGTTLADNANAGSVGEYITATANAVALTNNTPANITSISLTAGDWDVWGTISFVPAASTVETARQAGISTTSATIPSGNGTSTLLSFSVTGLTNTLTVVPQRINVSTTTTVYLVGQASFSTSTDAGYGFIAARRRR